MCRWVLEPAVAGESWAEKHITIYTAALPIIWPRMPIPTSGGSTLIYLFIYK